MNAYEIEVNYVGAGGTGKGGSLQTTPMLQEVHLAKSSGKDEPASVTWTFHHLPAGLAPVINFGSPEVIASGPAAAVGDPLKITFEIRFPPSASNELSTYPVHYEISMPAGSVRRSKRAEALPPEEDDPTLVVIRSPDPPPPPPSGSLTLEATSQTKA